jgi:hypothetical protein
MTSAKEPGQGYAFLEHENFQYQVFDSDCRGRTSGLRVKIEVVKSPSVLNNLGRCWMGYFVKMARGFGILI